MTWLPVYFVGLFLALIGAAVAALMPRAGWRWPAPLGLGAGAGLGVIGWVALDLAGANCSLNDSGPFDSCFVSPMAGLAGGAAAVVGAVVAFHLASRRAEGRNV